MRVLQLSSAQAFGGGERHLTDLANALTARGHDVYVAVRPDSPVRDELKLPRDHVVTMPLRNALDARSASALAKLVHTRKIEIIHAHMARDYPLAAYATRRNPEARLVVTRHVMFPLNRLHKVTLAYVSRLIAVSHAVAREMRTQALIAPEKIAVVHNGVDMKKIDDARQRFNRSEFCRRWDLPSEALLVGSIGTLTLLKGHEDFLQAAAKVPHLAPSAFFIVSGTESSATKGYRSRLERLIQQLKLTEHVRIIGRMEDISELYCALDLFVSASHSESFGLAIVEAMAAGTAVVATETDGAREIVRDGSTGLLVPVGGVEPLERAINDLLLNQEKRRRMADEARAEAQQRFSLDRMVEETERIYSEVLGLKERGQAPFPT